MGILDTQIVRRVRRNHAVEHATIHILTPKYAHQGIAGRADTHGFFLYGRVETADVEKAVDSALERLVGEPELAVHPRCGTNLVVSGFVAGLASLFAVASIPPDRRRGASPADVLPRLLLAGTAAALASASLGPLVQQRYTTLPEVEGVIVKDIRRIERGGAVIHRVVLEGLPAAPAFALA